MAAMYRVDFTIANTEDLHQSFALSDTTTQPIDLAGADLKMAVEPVSDAGHLDISIANGRIAVTDAAAGQFAITVPAAVMRTLVPGSYRHDLLLTLASGAVLRVWAGALTLERGVTA